MNTKACLSITAGLITCASAFAQSYSVWLPKEHELVVTPAYTFQMFDEFWAGGQKVKLPSYDYQHTMFLGFEYGLTEQIALDLTGGYTWVHTKAFGADNHDDGLADTTFGVRYRILDEETSALPFMPSLGVRVGGIIEGTYDQNFPFSAGDGASGVEASLLAGKAICPGFGVFGDIGYRWRNHDVPEDIFGSIGAYATFNKFTAHVGYRHTQGLSGNDIGDPGFTFPKVKEIQENIETGLGYSDRGGRYYQFFYAHTLHGRNTGEKDVFGIAFSYPF